MSLNKNDAFLINEGGAQLALLHTDTECSWKGKKYYPPANPDVIHLIGQRPDGVVRTAIIHINSARGVIIGRDTSSGPYGIVCATNKKGGSRYTLGGGRLESTQEEGAQLQSPVECMVRELKDELNIQLTPPQLRLFALRLIYDQDPTTGAKTPKRNPDWSFSADAGFLGFVRETLTYAGNRGQAGETGPREVMSLNNLLACQNQTSRDSDDANKPLLVLPKSQSVLLARAAMLTREELGESAPEEVLTFCEHNRARAAHYFFSSSMRHLIRFVIPTATWVP